MNIKLNTLKEELEAHVKEKILPFWMTRMVDHKNGGFYGWATNDGKIIHDANKGAVLNTRILWTFSAAYRFLGDDLYLEMAERSWEYLENFFADKKYGGIYWMLNYKGKPIQAKKQIYALAFAIYAASEYYNATGNPCALELALDLFNKVEHYSFDPKQNGYFEAFSRHWKLLEDLRLSDKDVNETKTLNTHLHLLEAYTRLSSIHDNSFMNEKLVNLINLFIERMINYRRHHLNMFFDDNWNLRSKLISYGHDIEASWLLMEAAEVTGSKILIEKCSKISCDIAETVLNNAVADDGSLYYEVTEEERLDDDRHWWPQAEAMVGFMNAYQHTGDEKYINAILQVWEFIKQYIIHPEYGEWYFRINNKYQPYHEEEFAGPWKGPYHNGRMCFEMIRRINKLQQK
ncbi:MAG: N-acyl-D-glucosamine 2-epimerase [Bacteroides sp. SM23_62_1]|nr:MAG: N-acyl-D-glucosamine 2-epimerase [Bacteroides sp. SM23_62_1]